MSSGALSEIYAKENVQLLLWPKIIIGYIANTLDVSGCIPLQVYDISFLNVRRAQPNYTMCANLKSYLSPQTHKSP